MKSSLSVYFNRDRTYITFVVPDKKGLKLEYINSTINPIQIDNLNTQNSINGIEELNDILKELPVDLKTRIAITLPGDLALISQFPGDPSTKVADLKKLVNLEIRQLYPQFSFEDFTSNVFPMAPKLDGKHMFIAVIIPKTDLVTCRNLLGQLRMPIDSIEISQMNVHNAYIYNYPEYADLNVAFFGVQKDFIDVSVITKRKLVYYNLIAFNELSSLSDLIEKEFDKITGQYVSTIDAAYMFGENLTKSNYMEVWEIAMLSGIEVHKLNSFRMMITEMTKRKREYCARVAHLFPPCIGGCIPPYHTRVKFY